MKRYEGICRKYEEMWRKYEEIIKEPRAYVEGRGRELGIFLRS